ncbi:MAG: hypothetical protein FWD87_09520 [Spirochaetaceae bacterium]|nr:hypothetical protein [Spirochaetaceae bacterium]
MEIFQQMSEAPLQKCPECGGKIKRLVGGGLGVIFKGSGFYATDSRKESSAKSGKSDAAPSCGKCPTSTCPASSNS